MKNKELIKFLINKGFIIDSIIEDKREIIKDFKSKISIEIVGPNISEKITVGHVML